MSIATEIARLQAAKADIKAAIEAKGVTVPNNASIDEYSGYIDEIEDYKQTLIDLFEKDITSIDVPEGCTALGTYAFQGCTDLTTATLPSTLKKMGSSTFSRSGITSIVIPNSVWDIASSSFYNCSNLASVTLPTNPSYNWLNAYLFQGCTALTSVTIPASILRVQAQVFSGCTALTSVTFLPTTPPILSNVDAFENVATGFKIYVPSASVNAYKSATNWNYYANIIEAIQTD